MIIIMIMIIIIMIIIAERAQNYTYCYYSIQSPSFLVFFLCISRAQTMQPGHQSL